MSIFTFGTHIFLIANLQNQFVKQFLLLRISDSFIVIFYSAVGSCLLIIVSFYCFIKQFVVDFLYRFVTIINVQIRSATVNIFCFELAAVVIDLAFTHHCAYRSLHLYTSNLINLLVLGSVTIVKSNLNALLTAEPSKCNLQASFALSERQRSTFEKALSAHYAKLYCVTNRDDGDNVLCLRTLLKCSSRSSHIDTPIS